MHPIYCYLLKDIADIVLDYVYKPDIKKLNREYSNKVKHITIGITEYCIHENKFMFNYRLYTDRADYDSIYNISEIATSVYLPKNYMYSSSCNDLYRFNE